MKQAILIGAYKNHEQLLKLLSLFPEEYFNIYIHLNKIGEINVDQFKSDTKLLKHVHIFSEYKINWGGRNHLLAYIHLCKEALRNSDNYYFHYITGQDLPVKPIDYFLKEFNTSKDYLQTVSYPVSYLPGGAKDWFEFYHFFDIIDAKKYLKHLRFIKNLQIKLGVKRNFNQYFNQKFYGSTYWSLTRSTLNYVIIYTIKNPGFLRRLKFTFAPEEIYFSTIILNSPYSKNVINDNLRFMKWESAGRGGSPQFLNESDFYDIHQSNAIFARKFNSHLVDVALKEFHYK